MKGWRVGLTEAKLIELKPHADTRLAATQHLKDRGGVGGDRWSKCFLGVCGEWCVARALHQPFDPKPFGHDVGPYEVRCRSMDHYDLPIQQKDIDDKGLSPFILVTRIDRLMFRIVGWMTPVEANTHPEWRRSFGGYPPQLYVPQAMLRPMDTLPPTSTFIRPPEQETLFR